MLLAAAAFSTADSSDRLTANEDPALRHERTTAALHPDWSWEGIQTHNRFNLSGMMGERENNYGKKVDRNQHSGDRWSHVARLFHYFDLVLSKNLQIILLFFSQKKYKSQKNKCQVFASKPKSHDGKLVKLKKKLYNTNGLIYYVETLNLSKYKI